MRYFSSQRGSLLLEFLIALSIITVVLGIAAESTYVGVVSTKVAGTRDGAISLAMGTLAAVRNVANESWGTVYGVTKGSPYHVVQNGTKWDIAAASTTIPLENETYARSFTVDNVSRDPTTRAIETTYNASHDDPSTQKIVVTVAWGSDTISVPGYIFRWRNQTCSRNDWSGGSTSPSDPVVSCSTNQYYSDDGNIDTTTPGSFTLK